MNATRPSCRSFHELLQQKRRAEDGWNNSNPERSRWPMATTAGGATGPSL